MTAPSLRAPEARPAPGRSRRNHKRPRRPRIPLHCPTCHWTCRGGRCSRSSRRRSRIRPAQGTPHRYAHPPLRPGGFPTTQTPFTSAAQTLESYVKFVRETKIDHSVIVHPEPYQDDHTYWNTASSTNRRRLLQGHLPLRPHRRRNAEAHGGARAQTRRRRIVALRIHATRDPKLPPTTSARFAIGIFARRRMRAAWRRRANLALHPDALCPLLRSPHRRPGERVFPPCRWCSITWRDPARALRRNTKKCCGFPKHPRVFNEVLRRALFVQAGLPHDDAKPLVRRVYDAFGPNAIVWGGLGYNVATFEQTRRCLDRMFDYAPESARPKVRGENAARLYDFYGRRAAGPAARRT